MTVATRHPLGQDEAAGYPRYLPIADALRREAEMLDAVADGFCPQVLVWQCEPCLVVPRRLTASASFPEATRDMERRGFPVFVRSTGGDAVVQGPGVVNISLAFVLPPDRADPIGEAYRALCAPLMSLLREHNIETTNGAVPGAMCDGAFNVTAFGRKLAGTAQRWRRTRGSGLAVLGHLALSVDIDHTAAADAVNAYCAAAGIASRVDARSHINLAELLPGAGPMMADAVVGSLASLYVAAASSASALSPEPQLGASPA